MATFKSTRKDDFFDGSAERDIVKLRGNASGYEVGLIDGKVVVRDIDRSDGYTGTDTLTNIDVLRFADRDFEIESTGELRLTPLISPHQRDPVITGLSDGGFIAAWQFLEDDGSGTYIHAQRFDATGNMVGREVRLGDTDQYHSQPSITELNDGDFAIVWSFFEQDSSNGGLALQRFDAVGNRVGGRVYVDNRGGDWQVGSHVTVLSDGDYVITWTDSVDGTMFRRYDSSGNAQGDATRISSGSDSNIGELSDGGYVLTWTAMEGSDDPAIFAQRFDAEGNAVGGALHVNTTTANSQVSSEVAGLAGGGFVITWESHGQDGSGGAIYAQRYDANGQALGAETRINTTTVANQLSPAIAALAGGGYVIAWESANELNEARNVFAQRYDASGNAVGDEFLVNTTTEGWQYSVDISALANGGFVISWQGDGWQGAGAYAQRYDANGNPVMQQTHINGTGSDDFMRGGIGIQVFDGFAGADVISAGRGQDTLDGGLGGDTLSGGYGKDTFVFDDSIAGGVNVDLITDFSATRDAIFLDQNIFGALNIYDRLRPGQFVANTSGVAVSGLNRIVYETDTGNLYYDADGLGGAAGVLFAVIGTDTHPTLSGSDFVVVR